MRALAVASAFRVFLPFAVAGGTVSAALLGVLPGGFSPPCALASEPPAPAFQPRQRPTLEVGRAAGGIRIDGDLGDPGWIGAARAADFAETYPGDLVRPPVDTEVLVAYDDAHLYLAFIAGDDPRSIRASLRDRDEMFSDDYMGIILDTYGDADWAYEIFVNPLGIQGDLRFMSSGEEDIGYDLVYASVGRTTATGYQVELAIPFSSLRFPNKPQQTWRANFWRNHPRDSRRRYSWAAMSRDDPCFLCQFGTLTGIRDVRPGGSLEVLPALLGSQAGTLRDEGNPGAGLDEQPVEADASLTLKYAITPSLSAEAAVNPDFSQVESDPAQIDVNTTFALFLEERRPFFQEGSDLFDTWIDAVYTRSLNDPSAAGKVLGRFGRTTVSYLGARDEKTPIIVPLAERSGFVEGGPSSSHIVRAKRTFGEASYGGLLLTDRRLKGGGSGAVLGADGSFSFLRNYRAEGQILASRTREPDDPPLTSEISQTYFDGTKHTVAFDGESYGGRALFASLEREARRWNCDLEYSEYTPTFRAANGFVTRNDLRQLETWQGVVFQPNNGVVDEILPYVDAAAIWAFDGVRKDEWIYPGLEMDLKGQTHLEVGYLTSREVYHGIRFDGIRRWDAWANSDFSDALHAGFSITRGRSIARNLATPVLGKGTSWSLWATVKPISRVVIEPEYDYAALDTPEGAEIYRGYTLRTRLKVQFTRELSTRLVVQYDDFDERLAVEPLISYKINPFSVFYAGSTHAYEDVDGSGNLVQASRQFFFKVQYLFKT